MRVMTLSVAALITLAGAAAQGAIIVSPIGATASSTFPGFTIDDTINHNGLPTPFTSGVTDFDTYLATNPLHDFVAQGNEWFSDEGVTSATIVYDLGSILSVDRLALWNEDFSGFGTGNIAISDDNVSFTALTTINPVDTPLNQNYGAQVFGLGDISARYIRFEISGCPQPDGDPLPVCGIGEVAFSLEEPVEPIPEPATLGIFGLGLAGLAFMRRKRARVI